MKIILRALLYSIALGRRANVEEIFATYVGERCQEVDTTCPACKAWAEFDLFSIDALNSEKY